MPETRTDSVLKIKLNTKKQREFARLLWKCRSMFDPDLRNRVVGDLEDEFNTSIKRNRDDDLTDIRHIIDACQYFENFMPLIESMQDIEQNSPPMQAIETFLKSEQNYEVNVEKREQYNSLNKILYSITDNQLEKVKLPQLYTASIPDDIAEKWEYPERSSQRETLMAIVEKLKGAIPQQGELYANQKFIISLALNLSKKIREALDDWVISTIEPWNTDPRKVTAFRNEAKQKRQQPKTAQRVLSRTQLPHLLIRLETPPEMTREKVQSDTLNTTKFCVTAWLFFGKNDMKRIHVTQAGKFYTSADMPRLLAQLCAKLEESTEIDEETKTKTVIDFFLKHEFFALHPERWKINESSTIFIDNDRPVVIRSSERFSKQRNSLWKVKWERLQNPTPRAREKHIHWLCNHDELDKTQLERNLLPKNITCLGLLLVPPPVNDPYNDAEPFYCLLDSLINTGTPVALWLRDLPTDPLDLDRLRGLVNSLLSKRYLSQLPEVLKKGKAQGLQEQNKDWQIPLLNNLSLLWEDPDVLPLDDLLDVPEIKNS